MPEDDWTKRLNGLTPAILITLAALLALVSAARGQMELGGAVDCLMRDGEHFTLGIDEDRGACDFGDARGRYADGVCLVERDGPRRITVDEASGAIVVANEETGQEERGVCGPG